MNKGVFDYGDAKGIYDEGLSSQYNKPNRTKFIMNNINPTIFFSFYRKNILLLKKGVKNVIPDNMKVH